LADGAGVCHHFGRYPGKTLRNWRSPREKTKNHQYFNGL
jgi:hypothetical protein